MNARIHPHAFSRALRIPASKSHTIRQLIIATLADGVSEIINPLDSLDTQSCAAACRVFGAEITERPADPMLSDVSKSVSFVVRGINGFRRGGCFHDVNPVQPPEPSAPPSGAHGCALPPKKGVSHHFAGKTQEGVSHHFEKKGVSHHFGRHIDVGNSGTTLYLAMAVAGLGREPFAFTGDDQIQRRSAAPLLEALAGLGVRAESLKGNGCVPAVIQGPWKGGRVKLPCPTSQYLSALLLAAPLAPAGVVTEIEVPLLNERPYVEMTLSYLSAQSIVFQAAPDFSRFVIPGGATWKPFSRAAPGDFSSAAFPACAAAVSGGPVTIHGLDPADLQGDKFFLEILAAMGCEVSWCPDLGAASSRVPADHMGTSPSVTVSRAGPLCGGVFDLNATPDLLPAAAVTAAFAEGDTALVNVAHARIKETDRIAAMAAELAKLGIRCTERPDGLVIHGGGGLNGGAINGRGDHRIVMAFAAAALAARAPITIEGAECAAVTYPGFLELLEAEWL
jgi:3-phosphoshikimate 1-carboxyvinyltransferase